jgi:hypothetical protein
MMITLSKKFCSVNVAVARQAKNKMTMTVFIVNTIINKNGESKNGVGLFKLLTETLFIILILVAFAFPKTRRKSMQSNK